MLSARVAWVDMTPAKCSTPHYAHVPLGCAAPAAGLHVLVEKPVAVHKAAALRLLAAAAHPHRVFAATFNQRTAPRYRRLRALLQSGELSPVRRVAWMVIPSARRP